MQSIINEFYSAFNDLDAERMAACYHDEVVFEDPAFGVLHGEHAANMWRMLCKSQQGKDFRIEFEILEENTENAKAHWEAHYTFSKTGKKIHNKIDASFTLKDGKIYTHKDNFNLHKWAGMALGFKGKLIGWTGFFRKQLHSQTNSLLSKFESKNS